jgi:hypothetical protein
MSTSRPGGRASRFGLVAVIALFSVLAVTQPSAQASRSRTTVVAPLQVPPDTIATLTADSAQLNGLVYHAPAAGTTSDTLELSSTSAEFTNLNLQSPCVLAGMTGAGGQGLATTLLAGSLRAAQGVTFLATSVTGTSAGATVTWTPASPPATADLGDVPLTDLSVQLVTARFPLVVAPDGTRQYSFFC